MTREEMLAEIEALKLDAYDPLCPFKLYYQAEIKRLTKILFPVETPEIEVVVEEETIEYPTFDELFS